MIRTWASASLALALIGCAALTAQIDKTTGTTKADRCEVYRVELMKLEVAAIIVGIDTGPRAEALGALLELYCLEPAAEIETPT